MDELGSGSFQTFPLLPIVENPLNSSQQFFGTTRRWQVCRRLDIQQDPKWKFVRRLCENSGGVISGRTPFYQTDLQETPIFWAHQSRSITEKYSTDSARFRVFTQPLRTADLGASCSERQQGAHTDWFVGVAIWLIRNRGHCEFGPLPTFGPIYHSSFSIHKADFWYWIFLNCSKFSDADKLTNNYQMDIQSAAWLVSLLCAKVKHNDLFS